MRRRFASQSKTEYILYCNQGSPAVFVDGIKVGNVENGVCKWLATPYNKNVTITLEGVTVQSQSVSTGWDHGNEVDGNYIGWRGQFPTFYGYKETHTYRFISGYYRDTYRNTAVTKGTLAKGKTTITINQSSARISREWYDEDVVTYRDLGEQSTSGTWNGSVRISGNSVTVDYGSGGMWAVGILINGEIENLTMTFYAKSFS